MNLLRHYRYLKVVSGGLVTAVPVALYLRQQGYTAEYLLLTLAPLRFGRAALTGASIVIDYKTSLYGLQRGSNDYNEALSKAHTRSAERLRKLCMQNGGCYTKVGQHLGVLDHLIPSEYVLTMRTLHTHSTPSSIKHIYRVIKQDFNKEVNELFLSFDEAPLASASLAQVHKARLLDGTTVVVKVQHPHVEATSKTDLNSMQFIFSIVSRLFGGLELDWLVEESRRNLPLELDFQHEALNNQKASALFSNLPFLKIPKVYEQMTSGRVLTMEMCEGGFVNDLKFFQEHRISVEKVVSQLSDLYTEMIFRRGFVHCDPHPGNILVSPHPQPTLILLDHGLYQTFPDSLRLSYCRLWKAMLERDEEALEREAGEIGVKERHRLLACILSGRSWRAVQNGLTTEYTNAEESEIRNTAPALLSDITKVLNAMPRSFVFLLKTNDLIRGVCRSLHFKPGPATLLHTARSFLRAIYHDQIEKSGSVAGRWWLRCCLYWHLTRLTVITMSYHAKTTLAPLLHPFQPSPQSRTKAKITL